MSNRLRNRFGKELEEGYIWKLRHASCGTGKKDRRGRPIINYTDNLIDEFVTDSGEPPSNQGFDKKKEITCDDVIEEGSILIRYGTSFGSYVAKVNKGMEIKYEELSLPYIESTVEFHVYKVVQRITAVHGGRIARACDTEGGATQYTLRKNINYYTDDTHRYLEEIYDYDLDEIIIRG